MLNLGSVGVPAARPVAFPPTLTSGLALSNNINFLSKLKDLVKKTGYALLDKTEET